MHVHRLHIGSDHAGFHVKTALIVHFREQGIEVADHGAFEYHEDDVYPAYCIAVGTAVVHDTGSLGIVIGGSGNGEQIAANKADGVRAALCWSPVIALLAREHNDANVMAIGARMHQLSDVIAIADTFVSADFSHGPRHTRRMKQIADYELRRDDYPPPNPHKPQWD
ncbi:MAG: RpiB/LacA/LacB family sugar-phosphate isomerase [Actinomycetales bacterium]|nr:RpiB/LacA/LacB family sugar-phosphate isomerase [Actinomycetales bacterium]